MFVTVKVLEKKHIMRERKTQYVMREKEVLMKINHPFFIRLYFTFQDADRLCILDITTDSLEMYLDVHQLEYNFLYNAVDFLTYWFTWYV